MTRFNESVHGQPEESRILSKEETEALVNRLRSFARGGGKTGIRIISWWNGELRWARNRVSVASDRRDIQVYIERHVGDAWSLASTNQTDDASLEGVVRAAERTAAVRGTTFRAQQKLIRERPELPLLQPVIWSNATYSVTAAQRSALSRVLVEPAEAEQMLSAGYLEMRAGEVAHSGPIGMLGGRGGTMWTEGPLHYHRFTQAQCSMTVRHPKGIGSGWAGLSSFDWSAIDGPRLGTIALQKCVASLEPVRIEPGRYTVILEPVAVAELVGLMFSDGSRRGAFDRENAERGQGPFTAGVDTGLGLWRTKLGLRVVDERITIDQNPMDPVLGILPHPDLQATTWIEEGKLTGLTYDRGYALTRLTEEHGNYERQSFRMSGGSTTIDDMIATTKRGLLVTRFSNLAVLSPNSMLATGVTRDGLWLIENGAITKAVKNMRITESPLFVLNQVEQLGVPVPVFHPMKDPSVAQLMPVIVPPLKVNDFSFTATTDAV